MNETLKVVVMTEEQVIDLMRRTALLVVMDLKQELTRPIPEIMNKREIAEYLRCAISKIDRSMKKGMPHFMFGDTPRFRKSDIDSWLGEFRIR